MKIHRAHNTDQQAGGEDVVAGHGGYWTKQMRDQVAIFVANSGNRTILSGST